MLTLASSQEEEGDLNLQKRSNNRKGKVKAEPDSNHSNDQATEDDSETDDEEGPAEQLDVAVSAPCSCDLGLLCNSHRTEVRASKHFEKRRTAC